MPGDEEHSGAGRPDRTGTCARAGLFAVLGTLLATFGHHAVAEGTVPWRLVGVSVVAQFAAVWPLARRRFTPAATVLCTLAVQGIMHLVLSVTDGDTSAPGHGMHAGQGESAVGDGHAWHHAGTAMTLVHVVSALVVAWLLHRADARVTTALGVLGVLSRAAVAAVAQLLVREAQDAGRPPVEVPDRQPRATFEEAAPAWDDVLEHAVVRRGPPCRGVPPVRHRFRRPRNRLFPYQQGVPPCPCPPDRRSVPAVVSFSPVPPR
ncbi:hypothetical protein ABZ960_01060 [Streptomyces pseudovenezuelae]